MIEGEERSIKLIFLIVPSRYKDYFIFLLEKNVYFSINHYDYMCILSCIEPNTSWDPRI